MEAMVGMVGSSGKLGWWQWWGGSVVNWGGGGSGRTGLVAVLGN